MLRFIGFMILDTILNDLIYEIGFNYRKLLNKSDLIAEIY